MSNSLKSFIPEMATQLGMTPAALYERQRALVRAGVLEAEGGRGPGSGVRSTSGSISLLMIAALASDSLTEAAEQTAKVAELSSVNEKCGLTGHGKFKDALISLMLSKGQGHKVCEISISKNSDRAVISYSDKGALKRSEFAGSGAIKPKIRVDSTVGSEVISFISNKIIGIIEGDLTSSGDLAL